MSETFYFQPAGTSHLAELSVQYFDRGGGNLGQSIALDYDRETLFIIEMVTRSAYRASSRQNPTR